MPLKRKGRIIYHKVGGKWTIKQRCKSISNAKKAMRLLQGISHGTIIIRKQRRDGIKQRYHIVSKKKMRVRIGKRVQTTKIPMYYSRHLRKYVTIPED
jgi:hypothetical protein